MMRAAVGSCEVVGAPIIFALMSYCCLFFCTLSVHEHNYELIWLFMGGTILKLQLVLFLIIFKSCSFAQHTLLQNSITYTLCLFSCNVIVYDPKDGNTLHDFYETNLHLCSSWTDYHVWRREFVFLAGYSFSVQFDASFLLLAWYSRFSSR